MYQLVMLSWSKVRGRKPAKAQVRVRYGVHKRLLGKYGYLPRLPGTAGPTTANGSYFNFNNSFNFPYKSTKEKKEKQLLQLSAL